MCVAPASDNNPKSIAAVTEGEEDIKIIASPSYKDYYKTALKSMITHLQMLTDLKLLTNCSNYSDNYSE